MAAKTKGLFSGFYFLLFSALGVFTTLLPIYLNDLGINKGSIGLIMAAGPLAALAGPPLWGYVADHTRSKKPVLLLCLSGALLMSLCVNRFPWVTALFSVYFCYNFFQSGVGPLTDSLVLCSLESSYYGNIRLWGSIGFAVGACVCGQALGYFPSNSLFLLYFALGSVSLVFGITLPKEGQKESFKGIHLRDVHRLVRNRQFSLLLLIILLVMVPYGAYTSFLGIYLKELGATPFQIGLAWTIAALAEVPMFAWGSRWLSPQRAWLLLGIGGIIFGLRWLAYGLWGNHIAILILQTIQSLSFGLFFLVSVQLVNWLSPPELKAVGQTVFASVSFGLSFAIGNLLGGYVALNFGTAALFVWAGVLALGGGGTAMFTSFKGSEVKLADD